MLDAIVRALDSPSLTGRLRVPLNPKEETWRPTSPRAAFGLLSPFGLVLYGRVRHLVVQQRRGF